MMEHDARIYSEVSSAEGWFVCLVKGKSNVN